jgi:hypothetical protein
MKTVLSNNDGFKYLVEVVEINRPAKHTKLSFSTEWGDGSEQQSFQVILSPEQRLFLKELL